MADIPTFQIPEVCPTPAFSIFYDIGPSPCTDVENCRSLLYFISLLPV